MRASAQPVEGPGEVALAVANVPGSSQSSALNTDVSEPSCEQLGGKYRNGAPPPGVEPNTVSAPPRIGAAEVRLGIVAVS